MLDGEPKKFVDEIFKVLDKGMSKTELKKWALEKHQSSDKDNYDW